MQEKKKEDMLFLLVKSLNKSEKRFFTLHSQLASHSKIPNYVRLFNLLEGMEEYNQEYVLKELGKFAPAKHFNQIKRYLKVHLLSALKQYDKKNRHIKQLDQLTYVQVFLAKGLSKNAEKVLQSQKKAFLEKEQCIYAHFINLQLTQLTSSREQLEDYYKNSIELLDIKTEMIELGIVKTQIQLIRYDKERLIKETRLDLENILQEMLVKFNYRQLKSIYSKALYLDSLFNLYMILENHDQALKVANEEYILLKTGYLSEQIANQCVNRINTLVLYKKTNNFTNYQSVLNQLYTLLDKHPYYKKQYIYWYYLRVIEYSLEQQTQLLPSNFTLQLLKDIEDPELNMSDTNKNGLYYHLAKYYFTNDEIQNTQNTLLKIITNNGLSIDDYYYLEIKVMNIITLYELNLPEIVNRELLSLRRKLKRENLLNPYLSNLFKLITQLNNSKDNKVKKARYFNKIYDLILERSTQKQSIFTKNLVFLKEWSLKKRS